jgi:molybdate transport system substrate-binding protein
VKYSFIFILLLLTGQLHADTLNLAAASNLRFVLPELTEHFEQTTGHQLKVSYAASGTIATQILHGAPFTVFMSASKRELDYLVNQGIVIPRLTYYADALVALYANETSKVVPDAGLVSLKSALSNNEVKRVVIANPLHAPYGLVAKEILEQHDLWQAIQSHLLIAENASQALQFSMSSQVSVGFVPYTYTIQDNIAQHGKSVLLDKKLPQYVGIIGESKPAMEAWVMYLLSDQASEILHRHGFSTLGRSH